MTRWMVMESKTRRDAAIFQVWFSFQPRLATMLPFKNKRPMKRKHIFIGPTHHLGVLDWIQIQDGSSTDVVTDVLILLTTPDFSKSKHWNWNSTCQKSQTWNPFEAYFQRFAPPKKNTCNILLTLLAVGRGLQVCRWPDLHRSVAVGILSGFMMFHLMFYGSYSSEVWRFCSLNGLLAWNPLWFNPKAWPHVRSLRAGVKWLVDFLKLGEQVMNFIGHGLVWNGQ